MGGDITNGVWYRVTMHLSVPSANAWSMTGTIQNHSDPTNPNSGLVVSPIATVLGNGTLLTPGNGFVLSNPGEVGVIAQANQGFGDGIPDPLNPTVDNVGVSITNFDPGTVPEPTTLSLLGLGGLALLLLRRRRSVS